MTQQKFGQLGARLLPAHTLFVFYSFDLSASQINTETGKCMVTLTKSKENRLEKKENTECKGTDIDSIMGLTRMGNLPERDEDEEKDKEIKISSNKRREGEEKVRGENKEEEK